MSQFPMRQADEIQAAVDIVKIVGDYVKLRKAGVNFRGLCPFHQEKTPSFAVHPTKQIFHCFGCGVGGNVFKFVMLIENISFPEALRRVAEKAGVKLREGPRDDTYDAPVRERVVLQKIHEVAAKFFAAQLGATAEGRAGRGYLADRGVSDQTVARFRLGYAPSQGQALTRHLLDAGFEAPQLEKSGLALRDVEGKRHYDRFRRRVMFPIANESGKVVAFGGRALGEDQPKYLNSPETPLYTKSRVLYHLDSASGAIRRLDLAILVEGYMDCIAVESCGIQNVVASCGTSLTEAQVRLLARHSRRVVVNYDPDSAGVAATERSLALLLEEGFEARVLALPGGLDPDSFIRKQGQAEYQKLMDRAPGYFDYLTERALGQHDVTKPEGKVAAANAVLPHLARVPSPLLRSELAARLAERLRLDGQLLLGELKRAASEGRREMRAASPVLTPSQAEQQLLRAFLEDESLAREYLPRLVAEGGCDGMATERIFKELLSLQQRGERPELEALAESVEGDDRSLVYQSAFWSVDSSPEQTALSYQALGRRKAEREALRLQAAIREAEQTKDHIRLTQLLEAKAKNAKQLSRTSAK